MFPSPGRRKSAGWVGDFHSWPLLAGVQFADKPNDLPADGGDVPRASQQPPDYLLMPPRSQKSLPPIRGDVLRLEVAVEGLT